MEQEEKVRYRGETLQVLVTRRSVHSEKQGDLSILDTLGMDSERCWVTVYGG